jgi:hypothetical protein
VPREICSLGRMNDDRTDLEVFQWASVRNVCGRSARRHDHFTVKG